MSAEYKIILKCKQDLVTVLAHDLCRITNELLSNEFIPPSMCDKMRTLGIGNDIKASELMDCVASQIKVNREKFDVFVEILSSAPDRQVLVDLLKRTLRDYQDNQVGRAGRSASVSEDVTLDIPSHVRSRSYSIPSLPRLISSSSSSSSAAGDEVFRDHPTTGRADRNNSINGNSSEPSSKRLRLDPNSTASFCRVSTSSASGLYGEEVEMDHPYQGPKLEEPSQNPSSTDQGPNNTDQGPSNTEQVNTEASFDMSAAIGIIKDVTDWRSLGIHLGVESSKLDEIARLPIKELRSKLIAAWFECDSTPSWDKLRTALRKPSVGETRAAERVDIMRQASYASGGSVYKDSPLSDKSSDSLIPFTEANVLDAIIAVSNHHSLALKLGIAQHKLDEIEQHPVEDRKQKLVSALFQTLPQEKRNWEWVNKAINAVKMEQWVSTRPDSMSKSVSFDRETVISSVLSIEGTQDSPLKLPNKMKEATERSIDVAYSKLRNAVKKKLKEAEPDMSDFYDHLIDIFRPEDISGLIPESPELKDIDMIFKVLTKKHLWGFRDTSKLESIVDMFIDDGSIKRMISDYKSSLNGYKANTKIIDRIRSKEITELGAIEEEYTSIATNAEKYDKEFRKKLSIQLFKGDDKILLTMKSLEFVEKVWNNLCEEFQLSLTSVLDSIVQHCIEISWFIPSESAQKILEHVHEAVDFFKKMFVSNVILEGTVIYSESCGVASTKTLEEVKLLLAVQDMDTERTLSLLKSYTGDLNNQMTSKNEMTMLMIPAYGGCEEIALGLLKHGAEVDKQDMDGWSALFYAVSQGHLKMINCLLEHGADMTLTNATGSTVLDIAQKHVANTDVYNTLKSTLGHQLIRHAKEGNTSHVEKILLMGADVDSLDPEKKMWTALLWASWHGHLDTVQVLLRHNANVNAASDKGWNPLILSSREGHVEVMKALIDGGADLDAKIDGGWSALMLAADFGRVEAGKLLLERGANINCTCDKNYTPLAQACQNGHHEFVSMLIDHKPDLNLNYGSWSPLMLACRGGHTKIVEILIGSGADIDKAKEDDVTPLHIAACEGRNEIVEFMIKNGVDVNKADINGKTALMHATKDGRLEVVNLLLSSGRANINLQEKKVQYTAPFLAVECKKNDILDLFMSHKDLDLNITDHNGNTLLDVAKEKNEEAFELIRDRYQDKMDHMIAYKRHLSATTTTRDQPEKLTAKMAQQRVDAMLHEMDVSTGRKPMTASAA